MMMFEMTTVVTIVMMFVPVLIVMATCCFSFARRGDSYASSGAQSPTDHGAVASANG